MRRRYGRTWRHDADAFPTRLSLHVATTACAVFPTTLFRKIGVTNRAQALLAVRPLLGAEAES